MKENSDNSQGLLTRPVPLLRLIGCLHAVPRRWLPLLFLRQTQERR